MRDLGGEIRDPRSMPAVALLVVLLSLLLVILLSSAALAAAVELGAAVPGADSPGERIPPATFLLVISLTVLSILIVTTALLYFYRGPAAVTFPPRFLAHTAGGLAAVWLINLAGTRLMQVFGEEYRGAPGETEGALKLGVVILAVVLAPAAEELFFREALLARVLRRWPRLGIAVTSVSFGLFHFGSGGIILIVTLVAMGAVLAWLRIRTASLGPPLIVHGLNNLLALLLLGGL
jgi:membrane protease YdiL (CAAX protease family)